MNPVSGEEQVPISEQFVVLEQRHPALKIVLPERDNSKKDYVIRAWEGTPALLQLPIVLFPTFVIILSPVLIAYWFGLFQNCTYSITEYVPLEETNDWMELMRWIIMLEVAVSGWIITHYTSILTPRLLAFVARKGRNVFSQSFISIIEMVSMTWRYFCYSLQSTLLWLVSLEIMPYPKDLFLKDTTVAMKAYYWTQLPWQFYSERVFLILCVSSYLITLEKIILHIISKEFNQSLYRDRVKKCLYSLWIIDVLRKAGNIFDYKHISNHKGNFEKLWKPKVCIYTSSDLMSIFILEHFVKLGKKSGERKQTMAKRLFRFLRGPDKSNELSLDDIRPFFAKTEVEKVFSVLDVGGAGDISEYEFVRAVDSIYQERADLIKVLVTNSDIISKLDQLMLTVVGVLLFFSIFPIVGFSPSEALVPLGVSLTPTIVACTLIFGESIKSIFAAIVFLFVTHPYDVGDRVYMDQGNYFVRKVGLFSTMFERWDGFTVYIPNSVLATKAICNVRRTGLQSQRIEICIPASTPNITLAELERRLVKFIQKENRDFAAVKSCNCELRELNQLVLIITLRHRFNFQEGYERVLRNNKFMRFLTQTIKDLKIEFFSTIRSIELLAPEEEGDKPSLFRHVSITGKRNGD